jgi:small subunit ribosomal protein S16
MVKIRLRRTGAKKQPHYRVVVAESQSPRDGKFIETIGHYNPRTEPPTVEIDAERALYWLSVGAQPTPAVRRMLDKMGIMSQVSAVRKGQASIDEILSELAPAKKAKEAVAKKPEPVEAEAEDKVPEAEEGEEAGLIEAEAEDEAFEDEEDEEAEDEAFEDEEDEEAEDEAFEDEEDEEAEDEAFEDEEEEEAEDEAFEEKEEEEAEEDVPEAEEEEGSDDLEVEDADDVAEDQPEEDE